ncbi:RSP_7527 family protein [Oceanibaculum pacificum]|uniref:YjiS-like domain-containing protein n=1 Tax=Oceanibaculum pacificum TaxID=580166 RepID=A0A154WEG5_9PROT|nr:DUF1127 domain-containing protein [Oceanibaculum pacificum]KZD11924.1 hypothetical protein AUP43_17910 [Oceanibaculum pacificum]
MTRSNTLMSSLQNETYIPQIDTLTATHRARAMQAAAMRDMFAGLGRAIAAAAVWMVRPLAVWYRKNRTYSELMSLDDRMLQDIGLHRTQVRTVAFDTEIDASTVRPAANTNATPKAA